MDGFLALFSQYNIPGALLVNIELTLWSALFSTILGVILVMMRISPIASLRTVSGAYVELFKNLPLTIIMVFMVLGAYAQLKFSFSDTFATNFFWLAVTGLSLYTAAFLCESLRSGINTVPLGQAEAARALGLNFMQAATQIILPQAFKNVLPAMCNEFVTIIKETSILGMVGIVELMFRAQSIAKQTYIFLEPYVIAAIMYFIIVFPLSKIIAAVERRMSKSVTR